MVRRHLRPLAAYSLIALMVSQPALAASPGSASRNAVKVNRTQQASSSPLKNIQKAIGVSPLGESSNIRQVVGKQPSAAKPNPERKLTLLPENLSGNAQASSRRSVSTNSPSRSGKKAGGLLGELFGGTSQSTVTPINETRPAAKTEEQTRPPENWEGVPYHQARSRVPSGSSKRTPIRDPKPGETRMKPTKSEPRLADLKQLPKDLPKPPALAPESNTSSSSRRVASRPTTTPARVASSRMRSSIPATLSSSTSSRRSGRSDVPRLDASEIAAAKLLPEDKLVPKVARRQVITEVASKPTPKTKPKPAMTPAADIPSVRKIAKTPTETTKPAKTETKPAKAQVAESKVAEPKATESKATEPQVAATKEVKSTPEVPSSKALANTPAPAPAPVATKPTATSPAPATDKVPAVAEVASKPTASAPAAASPTQVPVTQVLPEVAQAKPVADNFSASRQMAAAAVAPAPAAQQPVTQPVPPQVVSTPTDSQPTGTLPAKPNVSGTHFPTAPMNASAPKPPQFGHTANPTGHPVGPPQNAFSPRPTMAAPSPIGSGIANNAASATPNGAVLGNPTTLTQPKPSAAVAPNAVRQPAAPVQSNAQTVATPTSQDAFRGDAFSNPLHRSLGAPGYNALSPDSTAVASELPGIRVVSHGPRSVIIRQTYDFNIRVENRGSIDAQGVMVRAVIPDWAEVRGQTTTRGQVDSQVIETSDRLVWKIDSLPAGSQETMVVRLQALRSGTHPVDVDWTLIPQKSVAQIQVREPKLDLLIEGPASVVYGESQTYKVRVLNPGDGIAPNVVFTLSPNSPTPQTQRIGDIPSGKEAQFEVELTAQDLGDLKIHGLAMGELDLKAEASKTIEVAAAQLESVLTGPELKYQDTNSTYHLEVTNNGTATSEDINAVLTLPHGVEYLGGIGIAKLRGQKLTWPILSLPPGASREFEIECAMKSPGKKAFEFKAEGTAAGKTEVALDTQVESIADLVMTIQDPMAPAPVGSEVVYEILIKNRGSRDARSVRAIAQFSHGIEPRRVEGHTGQVLTGQVLFDPIDKIAAGQQVRIRVVAEAESAGHHRFRTEIRSGETVLVAEEATHYMTQRSERVSRRSSSSSLR